MAPEMLDQSNPEKRVLQGPGILAEPKVGRILYPVPDDSWFPIFRCGEFAVVETDVSEILDKHFYLRRGEFAPPRIVQLRLTDKKTLKLSGPGSRGVHWDVDTGAQTAFRMDNGMPSDEIGLNGRFHMMDGPFPEKYLLPQIMGRVTGVLGAGDRSLNWMGRV